MDHCGDWTIPDGIIGLVGGCGRMTSDDVARLVIRGGGWTTFDDLVKLVIRGVGAGISVGIGVLIENIGKEASLSFFILASEVVSTPFLFATCYNLSKLILFIAMDKII